MSESEVSQIQDEDVLRRMWQATEDFGRKKEIRAHMYRLREERLRSLYSPDPDQGGKGCEFSGARGHGQSFADQNFQSMKSKEVRDAGSPPKEFSYRGQDLKELSNAGWNVESEDRTTDGGRTHVKFVNANIEGQYDVEGGVGRFAADDQQRRAITETQDEHSRSRRDESASSTAAHEHVVRRSENGARVSSTTSSSNTSSQVRHESSTTYDAPLHERFDQRTIDGSDTRERVTRITNSDDCERSQQIDSPQAELVSRKVDYPDDNSKVIVETRVLPDGTRVTSTRREFRVPAQSTRTEHHARSETYSSNHSERRDTSSDTTRTTTDRRKHDIVDSQRNVDDYDFKRQLREYTNNARDDCSDTQQRHVINTNRDVTDLTRTKDEYTEKRYETKGNTKIIDQSRNDNHAHSERRTIDKQIDNRVDETDRHHTTRTQDHDFQRKHVRETHHVHDTEEKVVTKNYNKENIQLMTSGTTVVTDGTRSIPRETVPSDKEDTIPKYTTEKATPGTLQEKTVLIDQIHSINEPETFQANPREVKNPRSQDIPYDIKTTKDTHQEEVIERNKLSENYQTTYQNDFQSRKVSTDWSPTHQAWASTLRADTPSTTRASTRASSPGSRTFKSSTSSLRSSVSPDKTYRKPLSRGGSPNKADRFSPTRTVTSDRYSSSHSTQTLNEEKFNKHTSPDRKTPSGRSPTRPGYSPDRKQPGTHHHRPSVSPEKVPKNSSDHTKFSHEPRFTDDSPRISSPTRKNGEPKSPTRATSSPEKQPARPSNDNRTSPERNIDNYPRSSPQRFSPSPDRKQGFQKPIILDTSTKRPSVSPDRKPSYMKPTVSSQPDNFTHKPSNEPVRKTTVKISDNRSQELNKTTKLIEDHYKFVDEETKEYTQKNQTIKDTSKSEIVHSRQKTPTKPDSPIEHSMYKTSQPREPIVKSKSPIIDIKAPVENDELYGRGNKTDESIKKIINQSDDNSTKRIIDSQKNKEEKEYPSREKSPSKYDTYEKKKSREVINTEVTTVTTDDIVDRKEIFSKEVADAPSPPSKKSPRDKGSPTKSPTRETKYKKNTTDFISSEITSEESNKRNSMKERPRQLVTPSTSPTRKPKSTEVEPSTGQSSPTTSVSGFVYFGSPSAEKPLVTDLDDFYAESKNPGAKTQRPETLNVKRSSSPSKIPCRSPSPEKHVPSPKDSLPRKSSLKKPSTESNIISPVEKPPTSFRVSPTHDQTGLDHKVVKKDHPSEPETGEIISSEPKTEKQKPPLQRRETYDDRCKKILGLVDDTSTEIVSKETRKYIRRSDNQTSPSISPCDSPTPNATSPILNYYTKKTTTIDVTDFISHEINDLNKTRDEKTKISSRDSSPTKLKDIMNTTAIISNTKIEEADHLNETTNYSCNRTQKEVPENFKPKRISESPEKKQIQSLKKDQDSDQKPASKYPKNVSPTRNSPEKVPITTSHIKTSTFDESFVTFTIGDEQEITKPSKNTKQTRVLKSPTRELAKDLTEHIKSPRNSSPGKEQPTGISPVRKSSPTRRAPQPQIEPNNTDKKNQTSPRKSPEQKVSSPSPQATLRSSSPSKPTSVPESPLNQKSVPGYMKTTKTAISKLDQTAKDVQETIETTIKKIRTSSVSPNRKPIQQKSPSERRTPSPSKPSRPSDVGIEMKPGKSMPSPPAKESFLKKSEDKYVPSSSPIQPSTDKIPCYMKPTSSIALKHDATEYNQSKTEVIEETMLSKITEKTHIRESESGINHPEFMSPNKTSPVLSETPRKISPIRNTDNLKPKETKSVEKSPKDFSPDKEDKIPTYMKKTTVTNAKFEISENYEMSSPKIHESNRPRTLSPSKGTEKRPKTSNSSPERKSNLKSPLKESPLSEIKHPKQIQRRPSPSPERPSYMNPTVSITSKFDTTKSIDETHDTLFTNVVEPKSPPSYQKTLGLSQQSPEREPKDTRHLTKPEESRQLRTPSPIKKTTITETSSDFIVSEREQEILNKVQKSLRKLSPERKEKSLSRERSPTKSTTSLQDLDIISSETTEYQKITDNNLSEITEGQSLTSSKVPRPTQLKDYKPDDQKATNKPSSRNVSPLKRTPSTPTSPKIDKAPESPTKFRSYSPKKQVSHAERPQSPQQSKVSGIRHVPSVLTRKPTPATLSTSRIERLTTDVKKTNEITKQTMLKTTTRSIPSPTGKSAESDAKKAPSQRSMKDNVSPKKSTVTRTSSDVALKPKKITSPQRIKSKPEIQVNDISTKSPKYQKPIIKEPHSKLPMKPKSATSLNTSIDEDDIIIDVQQSKSSRENSPDRICPTPINFADDVGIPRFPDEVSEPDDELVKRTHHTIHETESVVDDIVEICEDEELFVKKSDMEVIVEQDDSLLSVNDKVSKFTNKIHSVNKAKNTATITKEIELRSYTENIDENLKSDECLLTVSEKVSKFAKGPKDTKDNKSPSRKITDEYDRDTVYTDDYTKLSVNDKAHLFVETAENIKTTKVKPAQKIERPDLCDVDESLKSDDCLLSVSDKVTKFVKSAEQQFTEVHENEEKETHTSDERENTQITYDDEDTQIVHEKPHELVTPRVKEPNPSQQKHKDYNKSSTKSTERVPTTKITTLRSSEAVKKAKALFENIASTQKITQKEMSHSTKSTKLTDIGVTKKTPKTDSTTVLHPSVENVSPQVIDMDDEAEFVSQPERQSSGTAGMPHYAQIDEKPRSSPNRLTAQTPDVSRSKSPMRQTVEVTTKKTILSRYPAATRAESPRNRPESPRPRTESPRQRPDSDKLEKTPGYLRPTKTSQIKEEIKVTEETDVSSRRGSGKFGVELRRTSVERSTVSSERRRSVEHHQPCIEDIFDLDLLEQMLEKVSGYEQRRRIRAQIRIVKNQNEHSLETQTKTTKNITTVPKTRSPERKVTKSPERVPKATPQRTASPNHVNKSTPHKHVSDHTLIKEPAMNGHAKEPARTQTPTRQRPQSPAKPASKSTLAPKTPVRQPSPDKRRPTSPSKAVSKPKGNRFNEYASAYMKKVGLKDTDKIKFTDSKTKKTSDAKQTIKHETQQKTVQEFTTTRHFTERTSSKDVIEIVQTNGKRSASPEHRQSPERKVQFPEHKTQLPERKRHSPERRPYTPEHKAHSTDRKVHSPVRQVQSPERLHQRTPSPDFKRPKADTVKETIIKTVYNIEKKIPSKPVQEEKPSWVTNRNLKKITSDSRTFSSKKIESEKTKYRAPSPSKVIAAPTDVITSSYGPGPLDADGKPLFGIKALRNGATNFQVKGTVIRQEFHSRNGGAPEGSVSVTAYSSQPEELEALLAAQAPGAEPASRLHGLAAITTTKRFGPDTGHTLQDVHTKEERASLEQFTHHDRRVEHLERAYELSSQDSSHATVEEITDSETHRDRHDKDRTYKREDKVSEVKRQKVEERREKMEKREDKKTVRQNSVKSLTEKYIKSANEGGRAERAAYPKAGLILRTTALRDSVSSDDAPPVPASLQRADSEHSVCSVEEGVSSSERTVTTTRTQRAPGGVTTTRTTVTSHQPLTSSTRTTTRTVVEPGVTRVTTRGSERSFLDSTTKVSGVQDILSRMKNADIVVQEGDTAEDSEARALLNKFLGATVLMAGMQGYVHDQPVAGTLHHHQHQEVRSSSSQGRSLQEIDLDQCWDERLLKKLLDECTDYEQRRLLRARIRTLMAEQEACASAVTAALGAGGEGDVEAREEEEVTVTSSVRRDSSDKTVSSSTTTRTSKVSEMSRGAPKPVSPFAKFRQLEKQNSTNSPNSPQSPKSPGSPAQPYFKFTDPALQSSALTIKERLLQWCRDKTRDYENVKLENFSTSWADGLAFCALVHHFLPDAFDYSQLRPDTRRHNFTLAFKVADEKAGIYPLLDVDDMVAMRKPDWKCVFTYVQAIYRRFKDEQ